MTLARHRLALSAAILAVIGIGGALLSLAARDPTDALPAVNPSPASDPADTAASPPPTSSPPRADTARLRLENPVVSMNAEKGQLEATLTVTLTRPVGNPITGAISVTGTPNLDAPSRRFYLREPVITTLNLPGLPEQDRAAVAAAVRDFFHSRPVFAPFEPGGLRIPPMETPFTATGA